MADGPDWRRTIRARAAGEQALYIRQARPHIGRQDSQSPIMTPVVWIFDDCAEIIDHDSYNAWLADGDLGITALLYVCEVGRLAEGRIRAQKLAAITDLGHSRAYCGRHRPSVLDGMQERDVDTAYLMSLPEAKRCSQTVWSDRELLRFSGTDHAIAAGIKFAHDKIILISRSSLPVSAAVQGYAERKRVKISRLSIDNFEPKRMERFRRYHWVECPGYDGYDTPYEWCSRFVPPI
jgi:hypothetical protein